MEKKRLTSIKTRIKPIISGRFVVQEGFNPNYVLTNSGMRLSRVRIMATVVDKFISESGKFASLTLDDGTDTIRAKAFNAVSIFDGINEGDNIDITGRVREYQSEIYLVPEIIYKIDDINWELLRELEIRKQNEEAKKKRETVFKYQEQTSDLEELKKIMERKFGIHPQDTEAILQTQDIAENIEEEEPDREAKEKVLKFIMECDKGNGCDYSELIEKSGLAEDTIDTIVNDLLVDGICFEPRPGKIKKL